MASPGLCPTDRPALRTPPTTPGPAEKPTEWTSQAGDKRYGSFPGHARRPSDLPAGHPAMTRRKHASIPVSPLHARPEAVRLDVQGGRDVCAKSQTPQSPKSPSTIDQSPQHAPKFHTRRRGGVESGAEPGLMLICSVQSPRVCSCRVLTVSVSMSVPCCRSGCDAETDPSPTL